MLLSIADGQHGCVRRIKRSTSVPTAVPLERRRRHRTMILADADDRVIAVVADERYTQPARAFADHEQAMEARRPDAPIELLWAYRSDRGKICQPDTTAIRSERDKASRFGRGDEDRGDAEIAVESFHPLDLHRCTPGFNVGGAEKRSSSGSTMGRRRARAPSATRLLAARQLAWLCDPRDHDRASLIASASATRARIFRTLPTPRAFLENHKAGRALFARLCAGTGGEF